MSVPYPIRTKHLLIGTVLLNAVGVGLYAYLAFAVMKLSDSITTVETDIVSMVEQKSALADTKRLLGETEGARKKLSSFFVGRDGIVEFLEFLESTAALANVGSTIHRVSIEEGDGRALPGQEFLRLTFDVQGGFQEVHHFLTLFETIPYEVHPREVHLGVVKRGRDLPRWRADIDTLILKLK